MSKKWLFVLPFAFLLHDLEELFTLERWMAINGAAVPSIVRDRLPQDHATLLVAFAVLFVVYVVAVSSVVVLPSSRFASLLLSILVMGRLTNGLAHLAQGLIFMGYTPGLITAAAVEIPVAGWAILQLEKSGIVRRSERVWLFLGGWAIQVVGIVAVVLLASSIRALTW